MPVRFRLLLTVVLLGLLTGCGYKGREGLNLPGQPPIKEERWPSFQFQER
ncbi:MAG: hypothetical protein HQM04_11880 [Magnetococcales bacterium]|nr:hypothetical protein [Magnetococcales bacterium]MBF0115724.1 hypothetical protein [Magnetococcales bacterium]